MKSEPERFPDSPPVMDLKQLATRWSCDPELLGKRLNKLRLPAFNVGTPSQPDYRFRLPAIERWELANEISLGAEPPETGKPVPTNAPDRTVEMYDPYGPRPHRKPPGRK